MFGRMMKRYPLIPSLSRMRNKPISILQGLLRWTSMRTINFLRTYDSLKAFDDHKDYHIEKNSKIMMISVYLVSIQKAISIILWKTLAL